MKNLKDDFEKDKRGLSDEDFVEQVDDSTVILSYYGMGDSHEAIYSYDPVKGWKWEKYYDRWWENLSDEEKVKKSEEIANGLKKAGLTEIKDDGKTITFSRKEQKDSHNA